MSEIPRLPAMFGVHSRAVCHFSVGILNSIEEVTPQVAKVSCFIGPFGGSSGPAPWVYLPGLLLLY